jgi:hypothetical protein
MFVGQKNTKKSKNICFSFNFHKKIEKVDFLDEKYFLTVEI